MGVTIEIYRSRIGSHHNFTHCRIAMCRLKGKFWNQMLIMFYLKVFYLPCLKNLVTKTEKNNQVCMWYAQMVCYHVYVPLLLRLSNDVEENPGPVNINEMVDRTHTVHADFHQGNELMFGSNAGKQCVAMSLCSIVYNEVKSVNIWDTSIMNQILYYGNNLYSVVSQSLNQDFLLLTEVPELVDIENDTFHLQYSESFSGALFMTVNNDPYVTLEHAFNEIFFTTNYKSCLLTIGMNTIAIFMPFPDVFKIFDSHSRDLQGMPCASGSCILTSVEGVQNLVQYFELTSCSQCQNVCILFELKGVKCNRRLIDQGSLKSYLKEKECIQKRNSRNVIRQAESFQEKENRLAKERDFKRTERKNESLEAKEKRLAKQRLYGKNVSPQAREKTLAKQRSNSQNESSEAREKRLAKQRSTDNTKNKSLEAREKRLTKRRSNRQNESSEAREKRLAKQRSNRKNESPEAREKRLAKQRSYRKNESSEAREKRLAKQRSNRQNKSSEEKEKRVAKQKAYRKLIKETKESLKTMNSNNLVRPASFDMTQLIRNFHNSVSTGPLYVCTCCEQLWYKHSVCPADRIRLVNPDIAKYLQNFKSVDNVEWLCNTCSNHLRKGNVPPCAIVNGMKFPQKPNFFDLNELECRLIAPRLAFQKIFQAPRGRQLKITGNVVNVPADVSNTVNMLPRLSHETGTIKVQLKRRLQCKSSARVFLKKNLELHILSLWHTQWQWFQQGQ